MEEKKMILVTDGYDDKPICVASNTSAARIPLELQEFPMTGLIFAVRRQNGKVCLLHQFL